MKKQIKAGWPAIRQLPRAGGRFVWIVDLGYVHGLQGKRKSKTFDDYLTAVAFAELARVQRREQGLASFNLSLDAKADSLQALQILGPAKVSLLDAARFYRDNVLVFKDTPIITKAIEDYLAEEKSKGVRPTTYLDVKSKLGIFAKTFGHLKLSEVKLEDLRVWFQAGNLSITTRLNNMVKVGQLYNFCLRQRWVSENLVLRIPRPKKQTKPCKILTVEQTEMILNNAAQFDVSVYFSLALLAGVRDCELRRLDTRSISLVDNTIRIEANVAKVSQRVFEMMPNLVAFLKPYQEKLAAGGHVADFKTFRKNRQALMAKVGFKLPANVCRHSFGSYMLAFSKSAEATSHAMGNSPTMLVNHYRALVTPQDGERYWKIFPKA